MQSTLKTVYRIRSYVGRNSRISPSQRHACHHLYANYGLPLAPLDLAATFERIAPTYLEIGFGNGQSLLAAANRMPDYNFIGVETHQPGVGSLIKQAHEQGLSNLKVYMTDIIDVLEQAIPPASLAGANIFFPDPWPKRRHHERRLIQPAFLSLLASRLIPTGTLHLATDWEHYAYHMQRALAQTPEMTNLVGLGQFASRSVFRPIVTKFEQRALDEGRAVWELQAAKR